MPQFNQIPRGFFSSEKSGRKQFFLKIPAIFRDAQVWNAYLLVEGLPLQNFEDDCLVEPLSVSLVTKVLQGITNTEDDEPPDGPVAWMDMQWRSSSFSQPTFP